MSMSEAGSGTAHGDANVTISSAHARSSAGSSSCGSLSTHQMPNQGPLAVAWTLLECETLPGKMIASRKQETSPRCSEGAGSMRPPGKPHTNLSPPTPARIPFAGGVVESVTCCCRATRKAPVTAGVALPEKISCRAATASSGSSLRFCSTIACRASRTAIFGDFKGT
ncbi:hypothetical protein T484DRAFT_1752429 [Baffinella frigidus]|nr:hypothetical protein T484DRAFT_1752429 [Cryptophyta sp. CCMP2293]